MAGRQDDHEDVGDLLIVKTVPRVFLQRVGERVVDLVLNDEGEPELRVLGVDINLAPLGGVILNGDRPRIGAGVLVCLEQCVGVLSTAYHGGAVKHPEEGIDHH